MDEVDLEPDAPGAAVGISNSSKSNNNDNAGDSGDDEMPDYSQISALAAKASRGGGGGRTGGRGGNVEAEEVIAPFIPKRGEKDFEPTGFEAQARALEKSRKAMFDVIKSERAVSSKTISVAMWEPCLNRAIVILARGSLFSSIGTSRKVKVLKDGVDEDLERYYHPNRTDWERDGTWKEGVFFEKMRTRLELLPEEVLYLVERGSLECRIRSRRASTTQGRQSIQEEKLDYEVDTKSEGDWVPMSVQQAFATILFKDDLTRERYQLYAYLRRLGYVVQRKTVFDDVHSLAMSKRQDAGSGVIETEGIVADPQRPLRLVTLFDVLLYPLRRLGQLGLQGLHRSSSLLASALQWLRSLFRRTKVASAGAGGEKVSVTGLLGLGGRKWDRYEDVFDRLRIVPASHDDLLPHREEKKQSNDEVPQIFYYAWRPATRFKKTDPPLPEYRIAVVDARVTSLPSVYAFGMLLEGVPIPLTDADAEGLDEEELREWKRAQDERKRNDDSYGKGAVKKLRAEKAALEKAKRAKELEGMSLAKQWQIRLRSLYSRFLRLLYFVNHCYTLLPPGCASLNSTAPRRFNGSAPRQGQQQQHRPTNVFVPLKAGRRNVIVAVNDCGTTSLLRFGEAEFDRWRLAGSNRAA